MILSLSFALLGFASAKEALGWQPLAAGLPPATIAGPPTVVTFKNESGSKVRIFWVKYNGTLKAYGELEAGGMREQKTNANATWLIADAHDKPIGYFQALPEPGLATIPKVSAKPPLRTRKYSPRSKAEALAWQKELRSACLNLLKMQDLVAGKTPNPLNTKIVSTQDQGSYFFHEAEINSTPATRIKIVLTVPKKIVRPSPAVVAIAGHSGTRHSCYGEKGFATQLAQRGYITVSTKISQHALREQDRTMMGERLWDLMRCVDLLVSRPEVDPKRIGCAGNSLGGEMAMWLGGMDERIAATVSAGFLTRMDQLETNHCRCWKFPGLRGLADFSEIYALTAPRALMCQNGLKEKPTWFPVPLARAALGDIRPIYDDFGKPQNLAFVAHEGGHVVDVPALEKFFQTHLQTSPAE